MVVPVPLESRSPSGLGSRTRRLRAKLPASSSSDYGTPFYETFKRYEGDFYKIDKLLFSPAEVWLTSATTGKTFHGGLLNPEVLRGSLFEE